MWRTGFVVLFGLAGALVSLAVPVFGDSLFWDHWGYPPVIQSTALDGSSQQLVVSLPSSDYTVGGLDVDRGNGYLYYGQTWSNQIFRVPIAGGTPQSVLSLGGSAQPAGLNIDPSAHKMYWTERGTNRICVANLDGTQKATLVSNVPDPRGMDLDLVHDFVYWVEYGTGLIRRANLDGSNVVDVVASAVRPFDVAIDPIHNRLYWAQLGANTDNTQGSIYCANADGTSAQLLFGPLNQPTNIELDVARDEMYWTGNGNIMRSALDGSDTITFLSSVGSQKIALDIAPIPEPSTLGLLLASAVGLLVWQRRK
jgi:DNA-binding beta-propeller fold protein YncE